MNDALFKFYTVNWKKLTDYGFRKTGEQYQLVTPIMDGRFDLQILVTETGTVATKVVDHATQDEYRLHLVEDAVGQFVGRVRTEIETVLLDVRDRCFEKEIFKSAQAKAVIAAVREKYGDELEHLWPKFPDNAIWRRKNNQKWYGLLVVLPQSKLGLAGNTAVDTLVIRIDPDIVSQIIDHQKYFPAYHMNKQHWFTIPLDGRVDTATVLNWLDQSYALAKK